MDIDILKFGGTSLGNAKTISAVVQIISHKLEQKKLGIVVSAVGGITNFLVESICSTLAGQNVSTIAQVFKKHHLKIIDELHVNQKNCSMNLAINMIETLTLELEVHLEHVLIMGYCNLDYYCKILSLGERASSSILVSLLQSLPYKIISLDPQMIIKTTGPQHEGIPLLPIVQSNFQKVIQQDHVCFVMAGFIGQTLHGKISLLGRNSSDYSGSLMAAGFNANSYEIWTDVDGIFDSDPRKNPNAQQIEELSYTEAFSEKFQHAKVLHPKTLTILIDQQIPVYIKNTFNPAHKGTKIFYDQHIEYKPD
ncbi:aspartate kinase [bacterium]|nr:aspartate kinase [bacterium]NBX72393.1 aspartate kinase [bacterium]